MYYLGLFSHIPQFAMAITLTCLSIFLSCSLQVNLPYILLQATYSSSMRGKLIRDLGIFLKYFASQLFSNIGAAFYSDDLRLSLCLFGFWICFRLETFNCEALYSMLLPFRGQIPSINSLLLVCLAHFSSNPMSASSPRLPALNKR